MSTLTKTSKSPLVSINVSSVSACPYLDGKFETRALVNLKEFPEIYDQLAEIGFRRIENWAYKPICNGCSSCISTRVISHDHIPSKNQKRCLKVNKDLNRKIIPSRSKEEHYQLFLNYQNYRHSNDQMSQMTWFDYSSMINQSPIQSIILEYRSREKNLKGVMIIDVQKDGLSLVYSFFDPLESKRSLGTFMILDSIKYCIELNKKYLYLGYLVKGNSKMQYKEKFKPSEVYINNSWEKV